MKQSKFLLIMVFMFAITKLYATETEPNNTKTDANALVLNGSNTGAINVSGDEDWWSVTTNADGKLDISFVISNSLYMYCRLYDNDGTTELQSGYSNGNGFISKDGLAAGAYYIKVYAYYTGQLPAYTISNTLTVPAQVNDAEPNGTTTQAKILPLNNSKTGHVGYYYNLQRDTTDWYKVTTNADGKLRLTLTSHNGQYIYAYLYDNDGTTLLASGYSSSAAIVNKDGLAAGTYYVQVKAYYSYGFIPYTLEDSLFTPDQANDSEPNGSREQAITLTLNGNATGHTGYLYNNTRDSADWYKLTTNADGMITVTLQSHNGQYIYAYLYDNNGTTLFESDYSTTTVTLKTDGLKPGTYYIRVKPYYSTGYIPYTLSNTLTTYANADDALAEPNEFYAQAKTIPANDSVTGHVNFFYNGLRDTEDKWKINYTGSGNLTLTFSQENRLRSGSPVYTYFRVYKDTAASPIAGTYYNSNSVTLNLTALTQGYYYIRVYTYYTTELTNLSAYKITATFTQVTKASIKPVGADTAATCSNTSTLAFKCSKSQAPYTVQLYRYGVAYGSPRTITNNGTFTYTGLPNGAYYATAYGDGATGTAFGKSPVQNLMPPVTGTLSTTNITQTSAKTNWTTITCAKFYVVQYHKAGDSAWLSKTSNGNAGSVTLNGLTANTTYRWRVQAADSVGNISATSKPTDSVAFTTATLFASANDGSETNAIANTKPVGSVTVYPNPASAQIKLQVDNAMSNQTVSAVLKDMNGNSLWSIQNVPASSLNGKTIDVSKFSNGIYILQVTDKKNNTTSITKVVVAK